MALQILDPRERNVKTERTRVHTFGLHSIVFFFISCVWNCRLKSKRAAEASGTNGTFVFVVYHLQYRNAGAPGS